MKRIALSLAFFSLFAAALNAQQEDTELPAFIFEEKIQTKYDWSTTARQLTEGLATEHEQVRAIYDFVRNSFTYDAEGTYHHVDECWEQKKAVCQGYCELFYCLASAAGIESHIISGLSKRRNSLLEKHGWMSVKADGCWMFVDPTWGSGAFNDQGQFVRTIDASIWFDTSPEWMIFRHFPSDSLMQMLPTPVSRKQFERLPCCSPLDSYGIDGQWLLSQCLEGHITGLPYFMNNARGKAALIDIPLTDTLQAGRKYTFSLRKLTHTKLAISNQNDWVGEDEWTVNSTDGTLTLHYIPAWKGKLTLWALLPDGKYHVMAEYVVKAPDAEGMQLIERECPWNVPEVAALANMSRAFVTQLDGLDPTLLINAAKTGRITSVPTFYPTATTRPFTLHQMPLSGHLSAGSPCTFRISASGHWALSNGDAWYDRWENAADGSKTITVTSLQKGNLNLMVKGNEDLFYTVLLYTVE